VPQYGTPVLGHVAVWICVCVALRWAACLDVYRWWVGCAREMVEGPLDGLLMSVPVPGVGCNTGHLRVGLGATHLAESLGDWARLVCVWLLLDGLLPGRPVGAARRLRKRARVRRTSFCYLRCESRLCAVGVYEWCRRTVFYWRFGIDPWGSGSDLRFRFTQGVEPGPQLRFGLARNTNPNLNIGSGSCANLVQHVREPDHGQSRCEVNFSVSRCPLFSATQVASGLVNSQLNSTLPLPISPNGCSTMLSQPLTARVD